MDDKTRQFFADLSMYVIFVVLFGATGIVLLDIAFHFIVKYW